MSRLRHASYALILIALFCSNAAGRDLLREVGNPGRTAGPHGTTSTARVLTAADGEGEHAFTLSAGRPYAREAGVEHNVINASAAEVVFVEIELK